MILRGALFLLSITLAAVALGAPAASATVTEASDRGKTLGRLFFTPERRMALERQRQLNIQETQTLEGATLRLDGVVVRSSGKRTVWINNTAQHDNGTPSGVSVGVSRKQPGRATLRAGEEMPAELTVGETINRATRETSSETAGAQIGIHRPAPAKR